jgi:hypothetical protein
VTDKFRLTLVWLAGAICSVAVALAPLATALSNGQYIPTGQDAFYHARRILDAAGPVGFYEFDRFMHMPEGSLITWPWGFDYVMSLIVRVAHGVFGADPMKALDQIPMAAFPFAIALVVLICRRLGLGILPTLIAVLFTAFFPLNQSIYAVGAVDHHFAEHLLVLGSLLAGLAWLQAEHSIPRAAVAGVVLGIAPAIHNGLFILQLPLAVALLLWWLNRRSLPSTTLHFGVALVVSTALAALPSFAFRDGRFEFYTLSWFHVYASAATAITLVLLSRFAFSGRNLALLVVLGTLAMAPLAGQMVIANKFLSATVEGMGQISEAQSLVKMYGIGGFAMLFVHHTMLVLLLPITLGLIVWQLWKQRRSEAAVFWVASFMGLVLLAMQMRMHYFGSFALLLPWLVMIQSWVSGWALPKNRVTFAAVAAGVAAACSPGVRNKMFEPGVSSGDPVYDVTRPIYPPMESVCREAPGVMLAWPDDGHYVRFHTRCSVIANPFLLTPQHEEKIRRVNGLLAMSAAEVVEKAPDVKYVFARKGTLFYLAPNGGIVIAPFKNPMDPEPKLIAELLEAPVDQMPPHYRLIRQMTMDKEGQQPVIRLLEIVR